MREQSHKDEMSAAIRGDFERLRERGVAATLAPRDDDPPSLSTPADTLPDEPEAVVAPPAEPDVQPEIEIPAASGVHAGCRATRRAIRRVGARVRADSDTLDEPRDEERQGFFTRLFGR